MQLDYCGQTGNHIIIILSEKKTTEFYYDSCKCKYYSKLIWSKSKNESQVQVQVGQQYSAQ